MIKLKGVYEAEAPVDGVRYLVERLWPRGVKKESLHFDGWRKMSVPAPNCADGSATILRSGLNSEADTLPARPSSGKLGADPRLPVVVMSSSRANRNSSNFIRLQVIIQVQAAVLVIPAPHCRRR
jgi:hypothetical protein